MRAWRIAKAKYAEDLTGYGASICGGRWNHQDQRMVYAGLSPSVCCLESFVHQGGQPLIPMKIITLDLPDDPDLYLELDQAVLPSGWNALPADRASMDLGTEWLRGSKQLGLIVPSAVISLDRNILLNPNHPMISQVAIVEVNDFSYDPRMFQVVLN